MKFYKYNGSDWYCNNLQLTTKEGSILSAGGKKIRKIVTKLNENDYHIFARIANDSGLSVQEKIQEIVDIYIIVEKNRFKQSRINHPFNPEKS